MREDIYTKGEKYLNDILLEISNAKKTIDIEVYIIRDDLFGGKIFSAVREASLRGVKVRFLVDGFGSFPWIDQKEKKNFNPNLLIAIFHPMPFIWSLLSRFTMLKAILDSILKFNRRNHKKMVLIDKKVAFAGSHNFWDQSLKWKEVGLRLEPSPEDLVQAFEYSWTRSRHYSTWKRVSSIMSRAKKQNKQKYIQLHFNLKERRQQLNQLASSIEQAKKNVWLVTPYFVPPYKLLKALCSSAENGVDVRLVLPGVSDYFFMKIMSRYYYPKLLKAGVVIYEYKPEMLHAKIVIIDQEYSLGSANLNHRSVFCDLEIMIYLQTIRAKNALKDEVESVFGQSQILTLMTDYKCSIFEKIFYQFLLILRNWM